MLLGRGGATGRRKERFEREIRIAAGLRHPNIVTVHDSGFISDGRYGLVMEYIDGVPLDRWSRSLDAARGRDARRRALRERLGVVAKVCDAVLCAHQRSIVHRDLKPANILVDAAGEPHVLDFGIARDIGPEQHTRLTHTGEFAGTLAYASPEQVSGDLSRVDTRTDIYSLGVILYELVSGRMPYAVDGPMSQTLRSIESAEPVPLPRHTRDPDAPWVDGEVSTIILKALAKDPARRYQTVAGLRDDIGRYLAGEPIDAKRDSRGYVLRKYVGRHRLKVAFAATLLLALVAGLVVSLSFWRQAVGAQGGLQRALERAEQRERETRQIADFQAAMFRDVDPQTMGVRLREDLLAAARTALERSAASPDERADRLGQIESMLAETDFTSAGVRSIGRNVLAPGLAAIDRDLTGQPLVQAALWQTVAGVYQGLGLYEAALPPAERALETRRRLLGDDHPDTLTSLHDMAQMLWEQKRLSEAGLYVREALEKRRRVLGDDHPDTLDSLTEMGAVLWSLGKHSEAEPYWLQALEGRRRVLGDEDPITLNSIGNMGLLRRFQGRLAEAEQYYRESLEKSRRVLGEEHPSTIHDIRQLAFLARDQGRLADEEAYTREVLEKSRRVLGDEDPRTISSIANLGLLLQDRGRLAEAEPYICEALEKSQRVLGGEYPDTISRIGSMGSLLRDQGRLAEAEPYIREALEKSGRVLGDEHPITISIMGDMGSLLRDQGRHAEAEPYIREALEKSRRKRGDEHPLTIALMGDLGSLLRDQGRLAEAEALEKSRRVPGDERPVAAESLNNR